VGEWRHNAWAAQAAAVHGRRANCAARGQSAREESTGGEDGLRLGDVGWSRG